MQALYDNYELDTMTVENVTAAELREEDEFLNKILDTAVMKAAMNYLQQKGFLFGTNSSFLYLFSLFIVTHCQQVLYDPIVRVSEICWRQFGSHCTQEAVAKLDRVALNMFSWMKSKTMKYPDCTTGFTSASKNKIANMMSITRDTWNRFIWGMYVNSSLFSCQSFRNDFTKLRRTDINFCSLQKAQIIKYRVSYKNKNKPVNTMFIGTLPELEMSLYTVCHVMRKQKCDISLGGKKITIRTYPFFYRGNRLIGSAYPEF